MKMTTDQSCPICGLENISSDKVQCPQCDSDLSCFKALDSIPDEVTPPEKKRPRKGMMIALGAIILSAILIIVLVIFQIYRFKHFERLMADYKHSIISMDEKLEKLETSGPQPSTVSERPSEDKLQPLARKETSVAGRPLSEDSQPTRVTDTETPPLSLADNAPQTADNKSQSTDNAPLTTDNKPQSTDNKPQSTDNKPQSTDNKPQSTDNKPQSTDNKPQSTDNKFRTYIATEEDTLWDISKAHYGEGHYYPVLLEHNPHIGIYSVGKGVHIKILKETASVRDIYDKIVIKEGNNLYWNYTVAEGDSIRSVITKFYRIKNIEKITVFNPDTQLQPGKKIRILLK